MRVELPHLLSVLSHEIRGPVSVIQGYSRLMLAARDPADPETKMLQAILDASGRLAEMAKQASELRTWCGHPDAKWESADGRHLADAVLARRPSLRVSVSATAAEAGMRVTRLDHLATAMTALVESAARDLVDAPVEFSIDSAPEDAVVTLTIAPSAASGSVSSDGALNTSPVAFDRGGQGLAMVLASYVLAIHDAEVTTAGPGHVTVRLPRDGGRA